MIVTIDIETERLDNPQIIWLIVCKEIATGNVHVFRQPQLTPGEFLEFAHGVSTWVGHNVLSFDLPVLGRLLQYSYRPTHVIDTLVVSRLLNFNLEGGHSLESWGHRLGSEKIKFVDFGRYSKEMEEYCIQDVELTTKIYERFLPYISSPKWKNALRLEHDMAHICHEMTTNGFHFDIDKAKELYKELSLKVDTLSNILQEAFPPKSVLIREITPKATKHGTIHRQDFRWLDDANLSAYAVGSPFSLIDFEPFNPKSPKQVVERLNEAGWKPIEKTKGHIQAERDRDQDKLEYYKVYGWKVSETNLGTLPPDAPSAALKLAEYLVLSNRLSVVTEWLNAYNESTGRIHGSFLSIGAWTGRMSHSNPNVANIPSGSSAYAETMRALWEAAPNRKLVGVDADGIQLRILAHYMDDPVFTEALINGKKEDGSDAHSMNAAILGCTRDTAKTYIYAWILGAAAGKQAEILSCTPKEAREKSDQFLDMYPGLNHLKKVQIPRDAERGYFEGFDGRYVMCSSEHLMLAGYLQNGESLIMKKANTIWRSKLLTAGIDFKQVNFVHDEWQTEVNGDESVALFVAQTQAESIKEAGELFNLRCPMAGSIMNAHKQLAIGKHWGETH